jgi:tetratricopeptide (TPR) repeat protein
MMLKCGKLVEVKIMWKSVWHIKLGIAVLLLMAFSTSVSGQEGPKKSYRIFCGGLDAERTEVKRLYPTRVYRSSHPDGEPLPGTNLANALIVPVTVENYGNASLTIRVSSVSWMDFVSVEIKYVLDEEDWTLEDPSSSYSVRFYTRVGEEKDALLTTRDDFEYYDETWFIVEFDSPQLLKDGKYIWKPNVDFDALGAAIPDLSSENLFASPSFEEPAGARLSNWAQHRKTDLSVLEQAKQAMNDYLDAAKERFGFGNEQEARQFLQKVFDINSNSIPGYITLAAMDFETGKFQEALTSFVEARRLIETRGDQYYTSDEDVHGLDLQELYEWIGRCYHELEDFVNAESYYLLSLEKLKEPAFAPGPDVDDHWSAVRSNLRALIEAARKHEP